MQHYLDHAATTPLCDAARDTLYSALCANPSSMHKPGIEAQRLLSQAAADVAAAIGAEGQDIVFTSGATEANNLALLGAARKHREGVVLASALDHASVLGPVDMLLTEGFSVSWLPHTEGAPDIEALEELITPDAAVLCLTLVNSETGAITDIASAARIARRLCPNIHIHADAAQALTKLPVRIADLGVDSLSLSAHKAHGPKGIGALYLKKNTRIQPLLTGGGQQRGLRPGTEPVELACAFAAALHAAPPVIEARMRAQALRDRLCAGLAQLDQVALLSPEESSPYIVNFAVIGYKSEVLVNYLSGKGVHLSGGSACHKGARSHVLTEMGLPQAHIDSALRASFAHDTNESDIDALLAALAEAQRELLRADGRRGER